MPSCCFKECDEDKENYKPPMTLYRFPVNENLRQKWIEIIGIENINPRRKMWYVCRRHFYQRTLCRSLGVTRLRDFAVQLPSPILEKDMANYCKYKMGFSQKILMVDGAVPSKFHCQEKRPKKIINVRKDLRIDRKKKLLVESWADLHKFGNNEDEETLDDVERMIPEDNALIEVDPCEEDKEEKENKEEKEKEVLETRKDDSMESVQLSYSSSTDSAQSGSDVYDVRTCKLKKPKSKGEPSTSGTSAAIQNSELETVEALDLDEKFESVISKLEREERIKKTVNENTEILPGIKAIEVVEQQKCDAIIANVYHFLKQEYEMLKRLLKIKYDFGALSNILQRTAAATNVSQRTVIKALQAHKINMAINFDHIHEREYSRLNLILRKAMLATNARRLGRKGRRNKRILNRQSDDDSDDMTSPKRRLTGSSFGSTSSNDKQLPLTAVYSYDTERTINLSQENNNYGANNNNEEDDGIDGGWLTPPKEIPTRNIVRSTDTDDQQVPFSSKFIELNLPGVVTIEYKSVTADEYPSTLGDDPLVTESSSIALEVPSDLPEGAQIEVKFADEESSSTSLEVTSDPPEDAQVEVKVEPEDEDSDMCTDYSICDPTPLDIKPEPPSE